MIKTSKGKTQARTVVHEGKVYRGVMPNMNMKTDLKDSFEYLATIVEGMSSGSMNGNEVYEDFKGTIIENVISGEIWKLVNERGHVPANYTDEHAGRYSSQIAAVESGAPKHNERPSYGPKLTNFPSEVGRASDLLAEKMKKKEDRRQDEAIHIDVTADLGKADTSMLMEKMQTLFDEWERDYPGYKTFNKTVTNKLMSDLKKEVEARDKKVAKKKKSFMHSQMTEPVNEEERIAKEKADKEKAAKKKTTKKKTPKIKMSKKKKASKKKVAKKKKSTDKDLIIAR